MLLFCKLQFSYSLKALLQVRLNPEWVFGL